MGNKPPEKPVSFVKITDCCCGVPHRMKLSAWERFQKAVAGKAETVPVGNGYGCWRVPRIFIACHGLAAHMIRATAERYGWESVWP